MGTKPFKRVPGRRAEGRGRRRRVMVPLLRRALGDVVREKRLGLHMTMAALAKRAGLSQPWMSCIERGTTNLTLDTVSRLAEGLGIDYYELLGRASALAAKWATSGRKPCEPSDERSARSLGKLSPPKLEPPRNGARPAAKRANRAVRAHPAPSEGS